MVNKLSYTASYIAVKFYGLTLNPKIAAYFDDFTLEFYKQIVGYLPKHLSWNQKSLKSRFWRNFFVRWEEFLLPGDLMHIICRKFYIQQSLEKAFDTRGYEQLVILGSGFDHNGVNFSTNDIPVFEIDIPSMISNKKNMLDRGGYSLNGLKLCPIDPANQNIKEVLLASGSFDINKKTVFLAEGFFDYLSLDSVESILENITSFSNDFKLISTFFNLGELNFIHRFMFTSGVAMVGETLKLPLNKKEFIELLEEYKISTSNELSYSEMKSDLVQKMYLEIDLPVLKGFYILESTFNQ